MSTSKYHPFRRIRIAHKDREGVKKFKLVATVSWLKLWDWSSALLGRFSKRLGLKETTALQNEWEGLYISGVSSISANSGPFLTSSSSILDSSSAAHWCFNYAIFLPKSHQMWCFFMFIIYTGLNWRIWDDNIYLLLSWLFSFFLFLPLIFFIALGPGSGSIHPLPVWIAESSSIHPE